MIALTLFWGLLGLLVYLHGGYAVLLALAARLFPRRRAPPPEGRRPDVTVLVGAYNEEAVLAAKLDSLLAQDYSGRIDIVVVSDRSTDGTHAVAATYAPRGVRLDVAPERRGKAANFSALMPTLTAPIVVCTDAAGTFAPDVVSLLVAALDDPQVGLVGGRIVYRNVDASGVSRGEGLYWRYEVLLRTLESRTGGTVIVSGACYAVRRELFRPVPRELPDDFMSPLHVWDQGRRVVYEPRARITETVATTVSGEFRTKTRIISRNAAALWRMAHLLGPLPRPGLALKLWSHRLLRWLVAPMLVALLAASAALAAGPLYAAALVLQVAFYVLAACGAVARLRRHRIFFIPFYFCLVNAAAAVGLARALTGRISGTWDPVERAE